MGKEYRYRKNWKIFWMVPLGTLFAFPLIFLNAWLVEPKGTFYLPSKVSLITSIGQLLLFLILVSVIDYIRRSGFSISIEDDAIIYRNRRREKKILFNAISSLKFSFWEVGNGIKIVSENNTILLSPEIQNISGLLQELKNVIGQKGLSINYDQKKFFNFFKMAAYSDQSWARMDSIFWKLAVIIILSGGIGIVYAISSRFSSFLFGMLGTGFMWWIILSVISGLPIFGYFYTEHIFKRRFVKQIDEQTFTYPPRDIAYEKTIYRKVLIFGTLISIVVLILRIV